MAYIIERDSTTLVATSSPGATYFDFDRGAFVLAGASTDDKIQWSANILAEDGWNRGVGKPLNRTSEFPDGVTIHRFDDNEL